jgi:hypothetical protein
LFDSALKEIDARHDASVKVLTSRYDAAIDTTTTKFNADILGLRTEIQIERNARIRAEGALSTWRAIATFLGATGIVGIVLGLISVFGPR